MTEVEAHVALVCASTDNSKLLTGGTNLIWMVVDWVGHAQTALRNLAHDFGLKLSPCMCLTEALHWPSHASRYRSL